MQEEYYIVTGNNQEYGHTYFVNTISENGKVCFDATEGHALHFDSVEQARPAKEKMLTETIIDPATVAIVKVSVTREIAG